MTTSEQRDQLALDRIALMLGTADDWDGADMLESIATVINGRRPSVDLDRDEFLAEFRIWRGYDPEAVRETRDYVAEPSDTIGGPR